MWASVLKVSKFLNDRFSINMPKINTLVHIRVLISYLMESVVLGALFKEPVPYKNVKMLLVGSCMTHQRYMMVCKKTTRDIQYKSGY